jgi:UPF0755 protein
MRVSWKNVKLWLLVIFLVCMTRGLFFVSNLHTPLALQETNPTLLVAPGETLGTVSRRLESEGIIPEAFDLRVYARLVDKADKIRAGEYALDDSLTPVSLLEKLIAGDVIYHNITLLEGWSVKQALAALQNHSMITATLPTDSLNSLQEALGMTVWPEGMLFPDTYRFTRGTTDREILHRANALLIQVLEDEWQSRDVGLPYATAYEALIMASIIEKETGLASERPQISGVFVRRLQQNMRLQTDPTVIYGLGDAFTGNLTRAHLREATPYNTYVISGLPPTPIALSGRAAIHASLHPEPGSALYFVSRGDGSHVFSDTLEQHNAAVQTYQIQRTATVETVPSTPDTSDTQ